MPPRAIRWARPVEHVLAGTVKLVAYRGETAIDRDEAVAVIPRAMEHVLQQDEGKERFLKAVTELSQAFALSVPHPEAPRIRDHVGFFRTLRAALIKATTSTKTAEELDTVIRQTSKK